MAVAFGETAKSREGVGVVEGSYQRGPEGLTYRGWRVLIRGAGGQRSLRNQQPTRPSVSDAGTTRSGVWPTSADATWG